MGLPSAVIAASIASGVARSTAATTIHMQSLADAASKQRALGARSTIDSAFADESFYVVTILVQKLERCAKIQGFHFHAAPLGPGVDKQAARSTSTRIEVYEQRRWTNEVYSRSSKHPPYVRIAGEKRLKLVSSH
jgi:hypothetical protein